MAHDVFVAYASEDKTAADAVVAILEQDGIRCWVSPRDAIPGHAFAEDIVAAIHSAGVLVLLLSANANESPTVRRELERAVSQGLPILPLRLEEVAPSGELTYFLSDAHWLDAITPPLEEHVHELADTIRVLLPLTGDDQRLGTMAGGAEPGWHPDPLGRHAYRLWDGSQWTGQVSDDGTIASESAPPPSAGYAPTPAGGGRNQGLIIALSILAALVVVGLVVGVVALLGGGDAKEPEAAPPETTAPVFTAPDQTTPDDTAPGDSTVPDGDSVSIFDLEPGHCFDDSALESGTGDIALLACDTPHDNEVFAVFDLPGAPGVAFPGDQTVQSDATEGCEGQRFTAYVGVASASSRFVVSNIAPTQETWEQFDDREIVCFLYDPDFEPLTESAEGSNE